MFLHQSTSLCVSHASSIIAQFLFADIYQFSFDRKQKLLVFCFVLRDINIRDMRNQYSREEKSIFARGEINIHDNIDDTALTLMTRD